eukprot:scaffold139852_cov35-Tisochrysis_lutea.AAC.1
MVGDTFVAIARREMPQPRPGLITTSPQSTAALHSRPSIDRAPPCHIPCAFKFSSSRSGRTWRHYVYHLSIAWSQCQS